MFIKCFSIIKFKDVIINYDIKIITIKISFISDFQTFILSNDFIMIFSKRWMITEHEITHKFCMH